MQVIGFQCVRMPTLKQEAAVSSRGGEIKWKKYCEQNLGTQWRSPEELVQGPLKKAAQVDAYASEDAQSTQGLEGPVRGGVIWLVLGF